MPTGGNERAGGHVLVRAGQVESALSAHQGRICLRLPRIRTVSLLRVVCRQPVTMFVCSLQNADVLAARAVRRGRMKAICFWDRVSEVENDLCDAAASSINNAGHYEFEYERLPRRDAPCDICARRQISCLMSRRTSAKRKRSMHLWNLPEGLAIQQR